MRTVDVLREARALYAAAPSHAPAGDFPETGTRCVVMAIDKALTDDRTGRSAGNYLDVEREFAKAFGGVPADVVPFNAEHSTEEVLAVFDKAIEAVT